MTIGELAGPAGIRPYDVSAVQTLRSVLVAQRLGLSLAEIRAVASGERNLADVAMEQARELGATIRCARVRLSLLRHAANTTQPPRSATNASSRRPKCSRRP
jgi:DNA-binding transcriptional MerR regulator